MILSPRATGSWAVGLLALAGPPSLVDCTTTVPSSTGVAVSSDGVSSDGSTAVDAPGASAASDAGPDAAAPGDAAPDRPIADVAVGLGFACALTEWGAVKCWGDDTFGQLGSGPGTSSSVPVTVSGIQDRVVHVSAGAYFACALTAAGSVFCWGDDFDGQVGDGQSTLSSPPVLVPGLSSGAIQVATGNDSACALTAAGAVRCWGDDHHGELGGSDSTPDGNAVGLSSGATAISVGGVTACAIVTGGVLKCWGANPVGQLGDGTTQDSSIPVTVPGLTEGVKAVSVGSNTICAVTMSGAVECWGAGTLGQLGNGTVMDSPVPVAVTGLTQPATAVFLSGEDDFGCALLENGQVECWGDDAAGQLGDGMPPPPPPSMSDMPVLVAGPATKPPPVHLALGMDTACALLADGTVECWGGNESGQLGAGAGSNSSTPVAVPLQPPGVTLGRLTGPALVNVDCNAEPSDESFVISNPTVTTLTWTSSVDFVGGSPSSSANVTPALSSLGSTLDPGESAIVNVAFPASATPMPLVHVGVTISDGLTDQVVWYDEQVNGYIGQAPADLDLGMVPALPVDEGEAVVVGVVVPWLTPPQILGSPCQLFGVTGGGDGFSVGGCQPTSLPAAPWAGNVMILFSAPAGAAPGLHRAQFTLGPGTLGAPGSTSDPLCNGPQIFTATATIAAGTP